MFRNMDWFGQLVVAGGTDTTCNYHPLHHEWTIFHWFTLQGDVSAFPGREHLLRAIFL